MSDALLETDVCIVGAGAAGAVIAAELATRGVDVIVLESGPRYPLAQRAEAQRRFLRGLHPFPSPDPGLTTARTRLSAMATPTLTRSCR